MNTRPLNKLSLLLAALFSNTAFAQDSIEPQFQHTMELAFFTGDLNQDLRDEQLISEDSKHVFYLGTRSA